MAPFTREEVKKALFNIGDLKARTGPEMWGGGPVQEKKIEPAPIHRVLEIFFFSSNIYQTKLFIIFNRHLNNTIFSKFSVDTSHMQSHLNCVNTTLLFPPFFLTWYAL
jgi:hypothetical protein